MRTLYPPSEPFVQHTLAVGDGHTLHVAEYGRPDGVPAVFLHGGPGASSEAWHPRFFDPAIYRVVVFDQRGCGRSTPHASLEANTTWHLVADIERLREHLGIERWLVFGGSWGSTLGLAYAETHPGRVSALVLRGIFLCRAGDVHWFFQDGARRLLPDHWRDFVAPIPEAERGDLVRAYHRRLFGSDDIARMSAAKAWSIWEGRAATLLPNPEVVAHFANPSVALSLARIECDYFVNDCYLEPDQLVRDAGRLRDIPGVIVHGRYDLICPVEQADTLAAAWPQADYRVIADAGHAALEPGIVDALVEATDRLGTRLAG
ncbi:MAG: prolyl aminopeptidase [Halofilum sp. (in: g-proteobacteria)]|nr:prolyl aminopeptidase [Halofilum sp. (in: g-proteobacteria)]